jgi:hypothetical protein
MKSIVIKINNIEYTSIGDYMDNNNGIFFYCPDDTFENWIKFLKTEQPIIILWLLSCLQDESQGMSNSFTKKIIELGGVELIIFLKKYCWKNILDDIFIDFIFGGYSDYGEEDFPEIYYKSKLVEHENFEFSTHVFIETNNYEEFIEELNNLINLIKKKLI